MASLSDILTTIQNGVVAFNNFASQLKGSLLNISGQLTTILGDYVSKTANNSLSGTQTITNATDASSFTVGGAVTIAGGLSVAKKFFAGTSVNSPVIAPSSAPGTAWSIDCSSCTIIVAGSNNSVLPDGAGIIVLTDGTSTGATGAYLTGGSAAAFLGGTTGGAPYVAPTTTPAANKYSIAFNGTHYAIYNGNAAAITFTVLMGRTRTTT